MQIAVVVCYAVYVVYACIGVSRLRKARKDQGAYGKGVMDGIELAGGFGRGDRAVGDGENV